MTKQAELVAIAARHRETTPAVQTLLGLLVEKKMIAEEHLSAVNGTAARFKQALALEDGHRVSHDASGLVTHAAQAAAAISTMASLYTALASVLQGLGEDITY